VHNWARTAAAVAGVTFAVVLMFMQLGFLGAAINTATVIYDTLDFDILLRSPRYIHIAQSRTFPRVRLSQAAGIAGVESAAPLYVQVTTWRRPARGGALAWPEVTPGPFGLDPTADPTSPGAVRAIMLIGMFPHDRVFRPKHADLQARAARLTSPEFILFDRKSHPGFGMRERPELEHRGEPVTAEIGGREVQVVGLFDMGAGLGADGDAIISPSGLTRVTPGRELSEVSLGLIRVKEGAGDDVLAALQKALPPDVQAMSRDDVLSQEKDFWVFDTPIGMIFMLGVGVGVMVGAVIVYQVLASDVAHHLREYATLKAIGYNDRFLSGVVLQQAVILAVLGYLPGLVISAILYRLTSWLASLPITFTAGNLALVFVLTLVMCTASGAFAMRKLRTADPAELF
jgi:putative ABC transport system permease protein